MMTLPGGLLALALAGVAGYLLHSWLVFMLVAVSLTPMGMLLGWLWSKYSLQRHIVAHPEFIDARVDQAVHAGKWREASRWLLTGAKLTAQAALEPRPDRDLLAARAKRWEAQARACIQYGIDRNWDAFQAFRDEHRDQD